MSNALGLISQKKKKKRHRLVIIRLHSTLFIIVKYIWQTIIFTLQFYKFQYDLRAEYSFRHIFYSF